MKLNKGWVSYFSWRRSPVAGIISSSRQQPFQQTTSYCPPTRPIYFSRCICCGTTDINRVNDSPAFPHTGYLSVRSKFIIESRRGDVSLYLPGRDPWKDHPYSFRFQNKSRSAFQYVSLDKLLSKISLEGILILTLMLLVQPYVFFQETHDLSDAIATSRSRPTARSSFCVCDCVGLLLLRRYVQPFRLYLLRRHVTVEGISNLERSVSIYSVTLEVAGLCYL